MKKYQAILFDFDNTLFDSTTPYNNYLREFLQNTEYKNWGLREFSMEINTPTGTSDKVSKEITDRFWGGFKTAMIGNIKPYPEDKDALQRLINLGYVLGIVSRSTKTKIENLLAENNLTNYFHIIIEKAQKPDPIYLQQAIDYLGIPNSSVLYVGDEDEDIEIGINCKTDTAYCLRKNDHAQGTYLLQKEWIDKHKPTYFVNNLLELVEILNTKE